MYYKIVFKTLIGHIRSYFYLEYNVCRDERVKESYVWYMLSFLNPSYSDSPWPFHFSQCEYQRSYKVSKSGSVPSLFCVICIDGIKEDNENTENSKELLNVVCQDSLRWK